MELAFGGVEVCFLYCWCCHYNRVYILCIRNDRRWDIVQKYFVVSAVPSPRTLQPTFLKGRQAIPKWTPCA